MNEGKTVMVVHETYFQTHSWYDEQLNSFHGDIMKLKCIQQQSGKTILPKYIELSNQKMYIQASFPDGKPLTKYNKSLFGKNYKQLLAIIFSCIETGVYVHQIGCVMRQFSTKNLFLCKSGYHVLSYYQESVQNTLTVQCPPEYCTNAFYNFNVYTDQLTIRDLVSYRKFLAFPAELRLRQRIYFTINTDIYSLGSLMYNIITTKDPLSPYECNNLSDLKNHAILMQRDLKMYGLPEPFIKIILKMLYLYEGNYFYNLMEVHSAVSEIVTGQISTKCMTFQQFRVANSQKIQHNITNERILIDHLSSCIKYQMLIKMDLQTSLYECKELFDLHEYPNFNILARDRLQTFCDKNARQNLWQMFYSDSQGVLGVLQGYPGSGKTQMAMSIMNFFATRMSGFTCYVPLRGARWGEGVPYTRPPYLPASYARQPVLDFCHYVLLYVLYNVETVGIPAYVKAVEKVFKYQDDVNRLRLLAPAFCDAARVGPSYQAVRPAPGVAREVLQKVLQALQASSLVVFLAVDDLQTGVLRAETDALLELILNGPRLSVLVTECPGVLLDKAAFGFQAGQATAGPIGTGASSGGPGGSGSTGGVHGGVGVQGGPVASGIPAGPGMTAPDAASVDGELFGAGASCNFPNLANVSCTAGGISGGQGGPGGISGLPSGALGETMRLLSGLATVEVAQPQVRRPQRMTRKTISDIVSVGSATSEVVDTNAEGRGQASEPVDVRVRTYVFERAAQLGLKKVQNIAAQELGPEPAEQVLKLYGLRGGGAALLAARSGDLWSVKSALLQLFQHSTLTPGLPLPEVPLQLCVQDEICAVIKFLRNQGAFSQKEIEILQFASLPGQFVAAEWVYQALPHQKKEAVQASLTKIASLHGYALGAAPPNVRVKSAQCTESGTGDSIFYWPTALLRKIFKESFLGLPSAKLLPAAQFLLNKYRNQFSFTEKRVQRKQLFVPRFETENLSKRLLENLLEDVEVEAGARFSRESLIKDSSLSRFLSRKTEPKLLTQEQELISHRLDEQSYFLADDGFFVSADLLVSVLTQLRLPDVFDVLELLRLIVSWLRGALFAGQVPPGAVRYIQAAASLFGECGNWLRAMSCESFTPFATPRLLEAWAELGRRGRLEKVRNAHVVGAARAFYDVLAEMKEELLNFCVLRQRHAGFADLRRLLAFRYAGRTQQLKTLNLLIEQLITDQKLSEAKNLCLALYSALDPEAFTVRQTKAQIQSLYFEVMGSLKAAWDEIRLSMQNPDAFALYEDQVQKIPHYLVHIAIYENCKAQSLIFALVSVSHAVQCRYVSSSTLVNLYYLFTNYQSFGISQGNALRYVKQMKRFNALIASGELRVSRAEQLQLQLFYFCTRADIKEATRADESQFLYEMSISLVNLKELDSCWQLQVVVPWFFVYMDTYERHSELALLVQQLLKELTSVGQWALVEFLIITGQCALDKIERLDGCDTTGHCGKRFAGLNENESRQLMMLTGANTADHSKLAKVVVPTDSNCLLATGASCVLLSTLLCEDKIKAAEVAYAANISANGFVFASRGKMLKAHIQMGCNPRNDLRMLYQLKYRWTRKELEQIRRLYALYKETHKCD